MTIDEKLMFKDYFCDVKRKVSSKVYFCNTETNLNFGNDFGLIGPARIVDPINRLKFRDVTDTDVVSALTLY